MLGIRADIVGHNSSQCLNVHIRRNVITSSLLATKTLPGPKLYTQTSFFLPRETMHSAHYAAVARCLYNLDNACVQIHVGLRTEKQCTKCNVFV